jgi:predicted permease
MSRDQELDDEIQAHLDMAAHDRVERGERPEDAAFAVRREFGNRTLVTEITREMWGWGSIERLSQDVRYTLRMMRRSPGFTAVAILSLALGIGANTAIFSLINTLMLRHLPVRDPQQLVELVSRYPGEPDYYGFAWRFYEQYRDQNHVFSDLIGTSPAHVQVAGEGMEVEPVDGEYVVGSFFPVLGMQPAIGRLIGPEDDHAGTADSAVAVVSWSFWKNRFNLDPAILGKRILVDGVPTTVVGVARREFFGLEVGARTDLWMPVAGRKTNAQFSVKLLARLKPGVSLDQARAEMLVLDRGRVEEIAKASNNPQWRQAKLGVEPAGAGFRTLRNHYGKPLLALMAVVALLLLIACINIASLLLARGAARQRELAVRVSLGAGRLRLIRQALTESLLLSTIGSLFGIVLAYAGAGALVRIIMSGGRIRGLPHLDFRVEPDLNVLLFTAGVAVLASVLFGIAPAWNALTTAPVSSLREAGAAGETRSRRLFGQTLVVAQVALSMVLLTAAGLFAAHLSNLRNVDVGFRRDSVLLVTLNPQGSGYNRDQLTRLYQDLLARLHAIPGVRSATLSGVTPIEGPGASRFVTVEGFTEKPEDRRYLSLNWVGPRYFETLGTPHVAGRDFSFDDEARPRVAIVNQAMARYYFGDRSPIGKHVTFLGEDKPYEIVGLVADAKYLNLHDAPPRTIYMSAFQEGRIFSQFSLRTSVAPMAVAGEVQRTMRDALKNIRIAKVTTMDEQVNASIVPERLIATLSGFFGGLGALLAAIGLYGLLAYTIARRTNEIGVRMALGATDRDIRVMVLKSALGLVLPGLVIGAPIALWSQRIVASLVENVTLAAAVPIAVAAAAMVAVALLAAYVPARRAARVQPVEALRHS